MTASIVIITNPFEPVASRRARQAQAEAEQSRQVPQARQHEAEEALARARQTEQEQLAVLADVQNDKRLLADDKAQIAAFSPASMAVMVR
jgi:hypothetical protein